MKFPISVIKIDNYMVLINSGEVTKDFISNLKKLELTRTPRDMKIVSCDYPAFSGHTIYISGDDRSKRYQTCKTAYNEPLFNSYQEIIKYYANKMGYDE
jgi:hypothetical protein